MFGKIIFNVLSPYDENMTKNNALVLKNMGFEVFDLRESDVLDSDNLKIGKVYILCCKGSRRLYEKLKNRMNYREILYEGRKTLS